MIRNSNKRGCFWGAALLCNLDFGGDCIDVQFIIIH